MGTMYRPSPRRVPGLLRQLVVLVTIWFLPHPVAAWIETEVRGHLATVTVESDGNAEVRHELLLRVRGGPLQSLEIEGVSRDAAPLGDGVVRSSGSGALWPLELMMRDSGALVLRVGAERGLKGGVYRFDFGYRVNLEERGWLERKGSGTRLTWVQPRFAAGIDSARVIFRVPPTQGQPTVPEEGAAAAVLLTEVRRGANYDEIDLVRAHVARGEPAVWQVDVPSATFPSLGAPESADLRPSPLERGRIGRTPSSSLIDGMSGWVWFVSVLLGLFYAVLVGIKWRWVRQNCEEAGVRPRPLLPLPRALRPIASGLALGLAVALALSERPSLAGASLSVAVVLAIFLPPRREAKARGPGEWFRLPEAVLQRPPERFRAGHWLDAGTLRGALLFLLLVVVTVSAAGGLLPRSPYHAGLALTSLAVWLSLFLTGRREDMPVDSAWGALPLYRWLAKKLGQRAEVEVQYWGRRPLDRGLGEPSLESTAPAPESAAKPPPCDEIRLRLSSPHLLRGLKTLEVGMEIGGGLIGMPCVVVRATQDSPAHRALPRHVQWMRGRNEAERVALLRPRVPSRAQCLTLVLGLLRLLDKAPRSGSVDARPLEKSPPLRAQSVHEPA